LNALRRWRKSHVATRLPWVLRARYFISARRSLGLYCLRLVGPALLPREDGLSVRPSPMRTHFRYSACHLLSDQLRAYRAVRVVLRNDERATSYVELVGVRLGSRGGNCDGGAN